MCNCGCGGTCGGKTPKARTLSDDFNYNSYKEKKVGYYLADMDGDDVRRIAEEEARASITAENIGKIAQGDLSPITDVAVRTTKRVCTTAVTEELTPYIPVGIGILLAIFFLGRATA